MELNAWTTMAVVVSVAVVRDGHLLGCLIRAFSDTLPLPPALDYSFHFSILIVRVVVAPHFLQV
jgi:hypothetical protein